MRRQLVSVATLAAALFVFAPAAHAENVVTLSCSYSHSAMDDPILFFGQRGASHMHDFFGSRTTNASSTAQSLLGTGTTCRTAGDTAAYWFPQPLWNGQPIVHGGGFGEYWARPAGVQVETPPFGMKFVAGNAHAGSPGENPHLAWSCSNGKYTDMPRNCEGEGGALTAVLDFPTCWNGGDPGNPGSFEYPAGQTNQTGIKRDCPPSHSTPISRLTTHTHFIAPGQKTPLRNPFNPDGSLALSFASGPAFTYHGDFLNGWDPQAFDRVIQGCVNRIGPCAKGGGGAQAAPSQQQRLARVR
jgi:hypothetical protein